MEKVKFTPEKNEELVTKLTLLLSEFFNVHKIKTTLTIREEGEKEHLYLLSTESDISQIFPALDMIYQEQEAARQGLETEMTVGSVHVQLRPDEKDIH